MQKNRKMHNAMPAFTIQYMHPYKTVKSNRTNSSNIFINEIWHYVQEYK